MESTTNLANKYLSPRIRKVLGDFLNCHTDRSQPLKKRIKKGLERFELEAISRTREIYSQILSHINICELNILEIERNQLRHLLHLEELEEEAIEEREKVEHALRCYRDSHERFLVERESWCRSKESF